MMICPQMLRMPMTSMSKRAGKVMFLDKQKVRMLVVHEKTKMHNCRVPTPTVIL